MEEFIFSGNRQRWPYLRPIVVAVVVGGSAWIATCCLALLQAPPLPDLCLGTHVLPASQVLSLRALPASAPAHRRSLAEGVGLRPAVAEQ